MLRRLWMVPWRSAENRFSSRKAFVATARHTGQGGVASNTSSRLSREVHSLQPVFYVLEVERTFLRFGQPSRLQPLVREDL